MSDLPEGWVETTLGSKCLKIGSGSTPKGGKGSYKSGGVSLIRSQNILDFSFSYKGLAFIDETQALKLKNVEIIEGDILINITGDSVARVCSVPKGVIPARVNQHVSILRVKKKELDSTFLKYYLLNPYFKRYLLILANSGGTRNALTKSMLGLLSLKLPPLTEQKAIANILTAFDKKIALLQAQNQTLETLAQTVFKEWFVEFNYPDATGKMIDSEFGKIPKGWKVGRLGDEFKITMGQSPKGSTYNVINDGMVFYQGRAEFQTRFPKRRLFTTDPKRIAEPFDVLMSVRAPVGDINVAFEKCCIGRGLAAIQCQYKSYALYKMKSLKKVFDLFESSGTVFGSINKTSLENIEVIIPNKNTVEKYELVTKTFDNKILNNHTQILNLTKLRIILLPKLMNGKIVVKSEAEAKV